MNTRPAPSRTPLARTAAPAPARRPRAALASFGMVGVVGLALALAGCSSSDAATSDGTPAAEGQQQGQQQGRGAPDGGGRAPGVSGEVAAVDGTTAQVQGDDSQTAVTWTDDTTITVTVDGSLDDVTVGSCVVATTGGMPGGGDAADDSGSADEGSAASSVAVSEPVDGECTGGFGGGLPGGGGGGERPEGAPSDMPTDMPSGMPTDMPSGGPGGQGGFGGITTGKVTALDRSTLTVTTTSRDGESAEETVTVDDATAYTVQQGGSADDVSVGQCVTAQGEEDDGGALTATSLTVSSPGDDGCSTGFGGRGGFPGRSGGDGDA
ncbi:DUF5666 domain-containing protein [Isoptericola sp. NPDC056134]|uniref:DUF5666 domain-containing protein n=1 Tax=Isoptericola sp. NPDC056134 TaxID=3345723 RepID=UPI0035EBFED0